VRIRLRPDSVIPKLGLVALPKTISETLGALITHVERREERLNGRTVSGPALHVPEHSV
jgi:hypothetical protein